MTTTYQIEASYYAGTTGQVEFPEGKTWDDVDGWYVKWDTLHVVFKDNVTEVVEMNINSNTVDIIDWKRPIDVTVFPFDDEGFPDYDKEIASE